MAKLLINYPSRSRPHKFMKIVRDYVAKASGNHELQFFIKIDKDDPSMNNQKIVDFLNKQSINYVLQVMDDCKGKIDAINRGIERYDFDVLVCIADDMDVLEQNWDERIMEDMSDELDICLNYDIDPRLKDYTSLVVLPILGKNLYRAFGYVYHPSYISEWCDNEQTEVFTQMGKLKHVPKKYFNHDWDNNQDALMHRNMVIGNEKDKANFVARKASGYAK